MKRFKLSDSEMRLLLVLLAVLMFAAAYFLSFQKNVELSQEIEARNEEDQALVDLLESMIARQAQVEAQTEEYLQTIADIIAKYPPDVPTEKAITIVQEIESRTGISISSIGFSMDNYIVDLAGNVAPQAAEDAETESTLGGNVSAGAASVGYRDTLSMRYESTYTDFKEMVAYINGLSDRTTIPSITAAYDSESGNVSGSITVNMFYLTNTGREYEVPGISGINKGVPDIFRSGGGSRARMAAAETEENDEENNEENGEENEEEQEQEENE